MNYGRETSVINFPVFPKGNTANIRETPPKGKIIFTATKDNSPGKLSGNYLIDGKYRWYQVLMTAGGYGYVRNDVIKLAVLTYNPSESNNTAPKSSEPSTQSPEQQKRQQLLKSVLETDQLLYKRILILSEAFERCKNQGIKLPSYTIPLSSVTISPEKMTDLIIKRYTDRQNEINAQIIADGIEKATNPVGFNPIDKIYWYLVFKFSNKQISGLGAIPSALVYVAIGVLISVTLYLLLTKKAKEQPVDLKVSEDLLTALNTLPEDKKSEVLKDLDQQIKDAYKKGQNSGTFGMIKNGLLILAGAVAAGAAIKAISDHSKKQNPES